MTKDWAEEIELQVADAYSSHGAILAADGDGMISAALRKAHLEGARQFQERAAKFFLDAVVSRPPKQTNDDVELALDKMCRNLELAASAAILALPLVEE